MEYPFRCIAIDMGAGSIRVLVGTLNKNKLGIEEIHRFRNEIEFINGHDRWDIEHIVSEIIVGIKKAVKLYGSEIKSFGACSWGVDYVMLDENCQLIEIPVAYRDARTNGMQEKWETLMEKWETFRRSGINFYIFNTLLQLLSIKNSPIIEKAKTILFVPNYIYHRLAATMVNEITIASTSQLVDINSLNFDSKILGLLNIPETKFGSIIEPGKLIGNIRHSEINNEIKAISVCSHDTASAVVAIPATKTGFAFISTGTWCIVGMESEKPALSDVALNNGFTNERGYGNTYRVLKNVLGLWLIQGLQKSFGNSYSFADLEILAEEAPSSGLHIDPEDSIFFNPENMKDAFDAYFVKTQQKIPASPGEYVKCAYNSLCKSFANCITLLEEMLSTKIEVVHLIGGGSKSDYFCRTTANICGRRVISGPVEGAGIGNIIVQAIALGYIENLGEGRKIVGNSFECKEYVPDK